MNWRLYSVASVLMTTMAVCSALAAKDEKSPAFTLVRELLRYVQHPFHTPVFAETLALPLIRTAWITAAAGAIAHAGTPAQRFSTEERLLFANPDWRSAMTGKLRFLPGLF